MYLACGEVALVNIKEARIAGIRGVENALTVRRPLGELGDGVGRVGERPGRCAIGRQYQELGELAPAGIAGQQEALIGGENTTAETRSPPKVSWSGHCCIVAPCAASTRTRHASLTPLISVRKASDWPSGAQLEPEAERVLRYGVKSGASLGMAGSLLRERS